MRPLSISEMFGPTVQGEGVSTGKPALFVRLGLCNLDCVWCDTPYTWDWKGKNGTPYDRKVELTDMTVDYVVQWASQHDTKLVVISGGEPLVQGATLAVLIEMLLDIGKDVEIETNGTISPKLHLEYVSDQIRFNVSPKIDCSGVDLNKSIKLDVLEEFVALPYSTFKFVVKTDQDIERVQDIVQWTDMPDDRVWLMPEGVDTQTISTSLPYVIEQAVANNYHVTTRLHVHAYGDKRGV